MASFSSAKKDSSPIAVPIKNERECRFIFNRLRRIRIPQVEPEFRLLDLSVESYEARKRIIDKSFKDWKVNDERKKQYVSKVLSECHEALLPENEFEWIDKTNECQCRWIHAHLTFYHNAPFNYETSPDKCKKDIIYFLDIEYSSLNDKKQFLLQLKSGWNHFFQEGERFKWLNKDDIALVEWAWNYSKSKNLPMNMLPILSEREMHIALIIIFEHWKVGIDTKKLFIINIKKAFNQKKQRDKLDGKKAYNIVMGEDIKEKLNDLAKYHELKINQTLERLINIEYERVCNE